MKLKSLSLNEIEILDQDAYQEAGIQLLAAAQTRIAASQTRFVPLQAQVGLARLLNLLDWRESEKLEYLDEDALYADQLIHAAIHQAAAASHPAQASWLLAGEVLASAVDIYLLAKFSEAFSELEAHPFPCETIDSWMSHFEMYGGEEVVLQEWLVEARLNPMKTMVELALYLFDFTQPLICGSQVDEDRSRLAVLADSPLYPLVHHYNIANWVLSIRSQATAPAADWDAAREFVANWQDEQAFVRWVAG